MIDPEVADIQWARNTNPTQQQRVAPGQFEVTQARADAVRRGYESSAPGPENPMLVEEKSLTERLRRELMQLDLDEKRGILVSRIAVEKAHADKLMAARDLLEGICDRVSAKFAAETDANVIHRTLIAEIRTAMSGLVRQAPAGTS